MLRGRSSPVCSPATEWVPRELRRARSLWRRPGSKGEQLPRRPAQSLHAERGEAHRLLLALVEPLHDLILAGAGGDQVPEWLRPGVVRSVGLGALEGLVRVPVLQED